MTGARFLPRGAAVVTVGDSWRRSLATGWPSGGVTSPPSLGRDRLAVMPLVLAGGAGFSRSRDRRRIPPQEALQSCSLPCGDSAAHSPQAGPQAALRHPRPWAALAAGCVSGGGLILLFFFLPAGAASGKTTL